MMFSVIIPVYNVAPYLRECLDSVLAQTFTDWEAICIDDGSTDGSGAILDEYAEKDKRFVVIHAENSGVSAARNAGLDIAHGEWIAFLDSDDYWNDQLLSQLDNKIRSCPNVEIVCFAPIVQFYADGSREKLKCIEAGIVDGEQILSDCAQQYVGLGWHSIDKIYCRGLINYLPFRFNVNVSFGEDALFVNSLFAYAKKVLVCDDIDGYNRRMHSASATQNFSLKMWVSQVERFKSLYLVWKRTGNAGVKCVLRREAFPVLRIGCAYGAMHREECIDFLLLSKDFWHCVIPFMIFHGMLKSRVVALVLFMLPLRCAKVLLQMMR